MTNYIKTAKFIKKCKDEGKQVELILVNKNKLIQIRVDGLNTIGFNSRDFKKVSIYYEYLRRNK